MRDPAAWHDYPVVWQAPRRQTRPERLPEVYVGSAEIKVNVWRLFGHYAELTDRHGKFRALLRGAESAWLRHRLMWPPWMVSSQ
jgi:hypothetical protein